MGADEKPYRKYRGGRTKGRVPLGRLEPEGPKDRKSKRRAAERRPRRKLRLFRWFALLLVLLLVLVIAWAITSYLSFDDGINEANGRVPDEVVAQLSEQSGLLSSKSTMILVLGTDGSQRGGRQSDNRSDSIMLINTQPDKHRFLYLSIPRDLQVEIPGVGTGKINSAFQHGGPGLAVRTVKALTGLPINHVVFVDFDRFRELIDAVGGIEIDVARPIRSNAFDCPYKAKRCASWDGWRFERGKQHMDGRRALVYARIRENRLDPSETDFTRSRRQQQVIQATVDRITSFGTALRFPWIGSDVVTPLATDLDTNEALSLGWAAFRADKAQALHCRLGGEAATVAGESVILGSEDNVAVISMFKGESAPQAPPRGFPYAPGCTLGEATP
jgi:polyisoprenyl-teichoic acid--peptidoglycan teichoic acid transferase